MTATNIFFNFVGFRYSPALREIQKVLDLPELKIVKLSGTRWLTYEHCVKPVKAITAQ